MYNSNKVEITIHEIVTPCSKEEKMIGDQRTICLLLKCSDVDI